MRSVGSGAYEIRVSAEGRAFRTIYVAKLGDAIHVLHAFEKKSRKTASGDIATARARYNALVRELRNG